jgi:hypothetical protein
VATQAALNSHWDFGDDWDDWDWDGKDVWDCDWDAWDVDCRDWDAGCCAASVNLVAFLDDEQALTRTINRQLVTNWVNLLNIVGSPVEKITGALKIE